MRRAVIIDVVRSPFGRGRAGVNDRRSQDNRIIADDGIFHNYGRTADSGKWAYPRRMVNKNII